MPCTCYVPKKFRASTQIIIDQANEILEEYASKGYDLTLRQLFYQFVSRDLLKNSQLEYSRLGSIVNDARLAGLIDWDYIVDRTRNLRSYDHWDDPAHILRDCSGWFQTDKWLNQETRVEVWVEKDALIGVVEKACMPLDVPHFSCRGYVSQSEMWGAAQRIVEHVGDGKRAVILHLGDHDPSGVNMTEDIRGRLEMFLNDEVERDMWEVQRIALNMDQIKLYKPPPNPAKEDDSRYRDYKIKFGEKSWELDALRPEVLNELITTSVLEHRDEDQWEEDATEEKNAKRALRAASDRWDEVEALVTS